LKTLYEGLFIFPETLEEAQLDQSIESVKAELEKLGGTLESSTRLGKRSFARPLKKKKGGNYAVIMFRLEGGQIDALKRRLKLATNVFRVQFMEKSGAVTAQEA
jgi:ribosomal protein S6